MGVSVGLLKGAVEHIKRQGGKIVEGYPVDAQEDMSASSVFTGTASVFLQAGFKEVARNMPARPIFRFDI